MSNTTTVQPEVLSTLTERPYEFDFVQAVSILQRQKPNDPTQRSARVGFDFSPADESIRFRVATTFRTTSCQVLGVSLSEDERRYDLVVPFIGLIGVQGVMPRHYTQTVIRRVKQHDYAMRDFLDLFHHRIISMFFRASTKYQLPYVYQTAVVQQNGEQDPITRALFCLVGLGVPGLTNKLAIPDQTTLLYGGHFSDTKPTAHSLERMTTDIIGLPTRVQQFQFEWLYIDPSEQSRLRIGSACRLGVDVVIGERVPSFQSRFRIKVGPVDWPEFLQLLPRSEQVRQLADVVRTYVGISFDFDLQVGVDGKQIPKLVMDTQQPPMLGWTTWLFSEPSARIVEDAVFEISRFQNQ